MSLHYKHWHPTPIFYEVYLQSPVRWIPLGELLLLKTWDAQIAPCNIHQQIWNMLLINETWSLVNPRHKKLKLTATFQQYVSTMATQSDQSANSFRKCDFLHYVFLGILCSTGTVKLFFLLAVTLFICLSFDIFPTCFLSRIILFICRSFSNLFARTCILKQMYIMSLFCSLHSSEIKDLTMITVRT